MSQRLQKKMQLQKIWTTIFLNLRKLLWIIFAYHIIEWNIYPMSIFLITYNLWWGFWWISTATVGLLYYTSLIIKKIYLKLPKNWLYQLLNSINCLRSFAPNPFRKMYIITAICMSSKYPDAISVENLKSETVVDVFLRIFKPHGVPKRSTNRSRHVLHECIDYRIYR